VRCQVCERNRDIRNSGAGRIERLAADSGGVLREDERGKSEENDKDGNKSRHDYSFWMLAFELAGTGWDQHRDGLKSEFMVRVIPAIRKTQAHVTLPAGQDVAAGLKPIRI
jgi:hypothetical protein